jgi:hypothetical protein
VQGAGWLFTILRVLWELWLTQICCEWLQGCAGGQAERDQGVVGEDAVQRCGHGEEGGVAEWRREGAPSLGKVYAHTGDILAFLLVQCLLSVVPTSATREAL